VILFVLFGGSVGAVVFLHTQYGWQAVLQVLDQEMTSNLLKYRPENKLTTQFWDWMQSNFTCCGVSENDGWKVWDNVEGLKENWRVPPACCRDLSSGPAECMYEPRPETAYLGTGCAPRIVLYVQFLLYGVPIVMFLSLVFAFVTSTSVTASERRRKAQDNRAAYNSQSQYSIGAEDDFQHHAYPSAPVNNEPYNPDFYSQEMDIALPRGGYHHGGVGVYGSGPIGQYPTGTVPPPQGAHMPLLHQAPPSYNEVVYRK